METSDRIVVPYSDISGSQLRLHLFPRRKSTEASGAPTILFFHGGGWRDGAPDQFFPQCSLLQAFGFVCVSAEYRITSRHGTGIVEATHDAREAFRYLQTHAAGLGIDPASITLAGGSAGGQLAVMAAMNPGDGYHPARALVLFNPVLDLSPHTLDHPNGISEWKEYSPLHQDISSLPPTLIHQGGADREVDLETTDRFCTHMRQNGRQCHLLIYRDQGHGFFNRHVSRYMFYRTLWSTIHFLREQGAAGKHLSLFRGVLTLLRDINTGELSAESIK